MEPTNKTINTFDFENVVRYSVNLYNRTVVSNDPNKILEIVSKIWENPLGFVFTLLIRNAYSKKVYFAQEYSFEKNQLEHYISIAWQGILDDMLTHGVDKIVHWSTKTRLNFQKII